MISNQTATFNLTQAEEAFVKKKKGNSVTSYFGCNRVLKKKSYPHVMSKIAGKLV